MDGFLEILDVIDSTASAMGGASSFFYGISAMLTAITSFLGFIISGVGLVLLFIASVLTLIVIVVFYFFRAIPTYKFAKKHGLGCALLAFVPVFGEYCRMFILWKCGGREEFTVFNKKLNIKQGLYVFFGFTLIDLFGFFIIGFIVGFLNILPGLGQLLSLVSNLLYIVPAAVTGIVKFVYLRDLLGIYKPDEKANITCAIVLSVLDSICFGLVIPGYLFTLLKKEPLTKRAGEEFIYVDQSSEM